MSFQLLAQACSIDFDDERIAAAVSYVTNGARQDMPAVAETRWTVTGDGPWTITENGDLVGEYPRVDDVVYVLYQRAYWRAQALMDQRGWWMLHAASAVFGDRHVLFVGSKGAGKTTLASALLMAGVSVQGDEAVFIKDGLCVALPRRFHIRPATLGIVAGLAEVAAGSPSTHTSDAPGQAAGTVYGFDPAEAGLPWQIEVGRVGGVCLLEPVHHGPASLAPVSTGEALPRLIGEIFRRDEPMGYFVRRATDLLRSVPHHLLTVGGVDETVAIVNRTFVSGAVLP